MVASGGMMEIPPRMRRRVLSTGQVCGFLGNTSAYAEKSPPLSWMRWLVGKYLRVCGEEVSSMKSRQLLLEIPPRMRRRAQRNISESIPLGNTSAYAEKRDTTMIYTHVTRKYLRVCGEETGFCTLHQTYREIPPRMRRRERIGLICPVLEGNTSAYAEKSLTADTLAPVEWKYLRVCGEETDNRARGWCEVEIPPRMRRRGPFVGDCGVIGGNTSAYAEKRGAVRRLSGAYRKYLRVCGEESSRPAVFTKKFLQVREFRQIRSQAATDHRSPESLGDYSPSYLRRTPALGWDHY